MTNAQPTKFAKEPDEALSSGNYFKNQHLCSSKIISWSHRTRFQIIRKMIQKYAHLPVAWLLDFGCGDGTFLGLNPDLYRQGTGVDANPQQITENRTRFKNRPQIQFLTSDQAFITDLNKKIDLITCMETLEHCLEEEVPLILRKLTDLLPAQGLLIVSVPIETGLSLLVKQIFRRLASWRKIGDYQYMETYRFSEFFKMVFATRKSRIYRPRYQNLPKNQGNFYHGHKGFNYRQLQRQLQELLTLEKRVYSPVPFFGPVLNSQVYFICRKASPAAIPEK